LFIPLFVKISQPQSISRKSELIEILTARELNEGPIALFLGRRRALGGFLVQIRVEKFGTIM
jgi:hypothetical protein